MARGMTEGELIAAIVEDPEAVDRWLLYADWLSIRGEIINLELAVLTRSRRTHRRDRYMESRRSTTLNVSLCNVSARCSV